jgi:hypothetical protein
VAEGRGVCIFVKQKCNGNRSDSSFSLICVQSQLKFFFTKKISNPLPSLRFGFPLFAFANRGIFLTKKNLAKRKNIRTISLGLE